MANQHNRMSLPFLESASFWSNVAVVAFTVFAAVAGGLALYFSSSLATVKDAELSRFQTEAKVAIASADARAAEANANAAAATAASSTALERAAALELEAEQQRERAARAERDLLELQQRVEPRRLTATQRTNLIDLLTKTPHKGHVPVRSPIGDGEANNFASELYEVLKAAGWPNPDIARIGAAGGTPNGLTILVRNAKSAPPYARALQDAFTQAGIALLGMEITDLSTDVELFVGRKQ
jgi:hypothetical protein